MSTKVLWNTAPKTVTQFDQLEVGDHFKINTHSSQGAVYRKVELDIHFSPVKFGMEEAQTGKVFRPTTSPIKKVETSIFIEEPKPVIYRD